MFIVNEVFLARKSMAEHGSGMRKNELILVVGGHSLASQSLEVGFVWFYILFSSPCS
jgi:hypothetical protein